MLLTLGPFTGLKGCAANNGLESVETVEKSEIPMGADAPISEKSLLADVAFLASDELRGRHTMSPTLLDAARYLEQRYDDAGLVPLTGDSFSVPYKLPTGASATGPSTVVWGNKKKSLDASLLAPSALGSAGTVTAPVVFVGYGMQGTEAATGDDSSDDSSDEEASDQGAAAVVYDDFADIDLAGKIAVVLDGIPATPDMNDMSTRVQEIAKTYAKDVAPLLQGGDDAAALRVHQASIEEIGTLVRRAMRGEALPEGFSTPPTEAPEALDLGTRLLPVFQMLQSLPGPRFNFREASRRAKIEALAERGAVGVLLVRGPASLLDPDAHDEFSGLEINSRFREPAPIPVLQLSWKAADKLGRIKRRTVSRLQAAIDRDLKPYSGLLTSRQVTMSVAIEPAFKSLPNVVGVLPGTTHKDEYVVVGGHFDHIGVAGDEYGMCRPVTRRDVTDEICNGADDNASGSAVVIAIAEAFRRSGLQPARSIIFSHFSGEELGLLGSGHLVKDPNFPTSDVVAMINLDMVGRAGDGGVAIGGIKSSEGWLPLLDEIQSFELKTVFESEVAGRSDHANFYTAGVPVLFFFTGLHGDYHRATDNIEKLDTDGVLAIAALVFDVVKRAADGRPMPYVAPITGDGIVSALPGTNPETIIKTVGPPSGDAP